MDKVYTVSEINKLIKNAIDYNDDLQELFIEGTISNITYYKSGHMYFSIKDNKAQIKCTAFNYKAKNIPEDFKEGDKIKVFGDASFYEVRGDLQILVRNIVCQNELGEMYRKLEEAKKFLEEQGYLDSIHKKNLPYLPLNIGVVTAETGAAIQDIIKTIKKRNNLVNIYLYPAKVQGIGAEQEIIKGIETLNKIDKIDLIICGRGGGSIEDLWAFNSLEVALAFFKSEKPIISAVGHETDFLLTDLTADVRAATPTQAVEICLPEKEILVSDILKNKKYLYNIMSSRIETYKNYLESIKNSYTLKNFLNITDKLNNDLINMEEKLKLMIKIKFDKKQNDYKNCLSKVIALNPLETLKRGYTVTIAENKNIKSIYDVDLNDEITTILNDGKIISTVKERIYE